MSFALAVPLLMRIRLPVLSRLLSHRFPVPESSATPESAQGQAILRGIELALEFGRPLVRPGCLTRGLTRYYFLRRARVGVTLCFGIRRRNGELLTEPGHCWLELGGVPVLEASDPRPGFLPIYRLPEAGREVLKR